MYQNNAKQDEQSDNAILLSAAEQIVALGLKGLTLRSLAQNTGISASLLTYHYGSRQKLILSVFEHVRQLDKEAWETRTADYEGLAERPQQLSSLAHSVVMTIVTRECTIATLNWIGQTASDRLPALKPVMTRWPAFASRFWAARFGEMGIDPTLATSFAAALRGAVRIGVLAGTDARMLIWMTDIVQRACERVTGIAGAAPGDSTARQQIEMVHLTSARAPQESRTETPERIVEAASSLILSHGPDALTHRLIAKESGISLSSMTHHFQSLDEILFRAFGRIYDRASSESSIGLPDASTIRSFCRDVLPTILKRARSLGPQGIVMDEIILFNSRSSETSFFAGALLAMTGRTSTLLLRSIESIGNRADRLDGQIFRFILTGLSDEAARLPEPDRDAWIVNQCQPFLQRCWQAE